MPVYETRDSFCQLNDIRSATVLKVLEDRFHWDRLVLIPLYMLEGMSGLLCFSFLALTLLLIFLPLCPFPFRGMYN